MSISSTKTGISENYAPRGKQFKISGNVVPADVTNTVSSLSMLPQDGTIKVQLKRRLQYKSSALSSNVRPNKIQAAAWLATNSPLYTMNKE